MNQHHPTPTVTRTRRLRLTRESRNLAANLGAIVRYAVSRTSSEQTYAALLKISVRRLRQVARDAHVPLLFVAKATPRATRKAGVTRRTVTAWIDAGLLPKPVKISLGSPGGVFNRFPMIALEHDLRPAWRR